MGEYSEANYGSDCETKRGRSGFVFMSGGAAVSWGSKLQEVVTLSSTEADQHTAISYVMQEGIEGVEGLEGTFEDAVGGDGCLSEGEWDSLACRQPIIDQAGEL